jgi:hypothetical protein
MPYCQIHGGYDDYGCPDCKREEQEQHDARAEQARMLEEQSESLRDIAISTEEAAFRAHNPGDFQCPSCMMISLKRGARRCPLCRSDITPSDWEDIDNKVEEARKQAQARDEESQRRVMERAVAQAATEVPARTPRSRRPPKDSPLATGVGCAASIVGFCFGVSFTMEVVHGMEPGAKQVLIFIFLPILITIAAFVLLRAAVNLLLR